MHWFLFCECDVCWFVFVVDCVLLNNFTYKFFPDFFCGKEFEDDGSERHHIPVLCSQHS